METIAVCGCGNETWYIFNGRVECAKCHEKYGIADFADLINSENERIGRGYRDE